MYRDTVKSAVKGFSLALALMLVCEHDVMAQEKVKVAIGQGSTYDTAFPIAAAKAGIFKKHGLDLDIITTSGAGETIQAVVSGSVDIGLATGTTGVLGAFSKGAPIRVISAGATSSDESFVYVRADSPMKGFGDANGKTVAISTVGASTNSLVNSLADVYGIKPKLVPTGSIPNTYTSVMSGQVDVGWGAVPFGLLEERDRKIRILAWGREADRLKNQTSRVHIANARVLETRREMLKTFVAALYEAMDWAYASDEAVKLVADIVGSPPDIIEEVRSKYAHKEFAQMREVKGLDISMSDAVTFRYIAAPLSNEQIATLFQIEALRPANR